MQLLSLAVACACLFHAPALAEGMSLPVAEKPGPDFTTQLEKLDGLLAADSTTPVIDLIDQAGLTEIVRPADFKAGVIEKDGPAGPVDLAEVQRMNMRLALTMIGQAFGSEDNFDVLAAQTVPDQQALVIRKGRVTLPELRRILRDLRLQQVPSAGPVVLDVPLIIWAGASLELRPNEVLQLSKTKGAFLMNFGNLSVQGATIESVGEENATSPHFVPFVTTADGGSVQMKGAKISGLGFGATLKFSGFSVIRNALRTEQRSSWIEDSRFDDLMSVAVYGATDIVLRGNSFRNMRGSAMIVAQTRYASILSNVFSGTMPTNAIRIEDGSSNSHVSGNIVLGGEFTGIVIRKDSTHAEVTHNIVWRRNGGGITLTSSDCGLIDANLVLRNRQKGIEVRTSQEAQVTGNTVRDNHSAGIWVSDQPPGSQTYVRNNLLVANGSGVAGAAGENILLDGNDFSAQFPRFLSGDLSMQSSHIAADLKGQSLLVLTASGPVDPAPAAISCTE